MSDASIFMAGWFPGGETDHNCYQEAARSYAPDVPVHFLDGKNRSSSLLLGCGGCLFVASRQSSRTFGLAPVEAGSHAVVVSDWDGYRFTVNDGVEGFDPHLGPCICKPR